MQLIIKVLLLFYHLIVKKIILTLEIKQFLKIKLILV